MGRNLTALLALVAVVALGLLAAGPGRRAVLAPDSVTEPEFCDMLREIDVGAALGGEDPAARVVAVAALAGIGDRAPSEIRDSTVLIQQHAAEHPAIAEAARMESDDPDAFGAAFQAVYALRFQPDFRAASALVERFGVERCGIELSGYFDVDVDAGLDPSLVPGLDLSEFDDPEFEFDETVFEPYQLDPVEDPDFEFDRSGYDEYQLELEEGQ